MHFILNDYPILLIPLGIIIMYLLDLIGFLFRRNWNGMRRTHHWVHKLTVSPLENQKNTISKSSTLFPGASAVIASIPNYLSIAVLIYTVHLGSNLENPYTTILIAIPVSFFIQWASTKVLINHVIKTRENTTLTK